MTDKLRNGRLLAITIVLIGVGVIADVFIGYSPFPGYGALIGLGGCIALVFGSKWLGRFLLDRDEDYYPDDQTQEGADD